VLALDYGSARCGAAVCDPTETIVTPIEPIAAAGTRAGLAAIAALVAAREVALVVIGLPLSLSGADTAQTVETREFAERLGRRLGGGVPIELLPRVSEYLDLVMKLIFAFGITFELPVLLTLLAKVGIVSSKGLKRYRRYAWVGMFVVAAILAPPDIITQTGLALPLIALYEISIIAAKLVEPKPVAV